MSEATKTQIKCKFEFTKYYDESTDFSINDYVELGSKRRFVAKGNCLIPYSNRDLVFLLSGKWTTSLNKSKQKYEDIFVAEKLSMLEYENADSFKGYLNFCFTGIGPVKAEKIIKEMQGNIDFDSFDALVKDKKRLKKAVGRKTSEQLLEEYGHLANNDVVQNILSGSEVPQKIIQDFKEFYGKNSYEVLKDNPFVLINFGISFQKADRVCLALQNPTLISSYERISAGITSLLRNNIALEGHTFVTSYYLKSKALRFLNNNSSGITVTGEMVANAMNKMLREQKVYCEKFKKTVGDLPEYLIFDSSFYEAENYISKKIVNLLKSKKHYSHSVEKINELIDKYEKIYQISLSLKQREAVIKAINNKFSIITGGPGTGKTTVLKFCTAVYKELMCNGTIALTAPTGRASRRMALSTGMDEAYTIHSLLGLNKDSNPNEVRSPNQVEATIVFLDEASMCEIGLFYKLLYNSPDDTNFVLIGDPDQLKPVGAGEVLSSLLKCDFIPITKLDVNHRQLENSKIVKNAISVNSGKTSISLGDDFCFYNVEEKKIKETLLAAFVREYKQIKDIEEVQVITPFREKGELSAKSFNMAIQKLVNPLNENEKTNTIILASGLRIRPRDKVICQKNTAEAKNGDIGIVKRIYFQNGSKMPIADISFEKGEEKTFTKDDLLEMDVTLGYAITCHKSQGSEFKSVIMPISIENRNMLKRSLLYTTITRAKERFSVVGSPQQFIDAIKNNTETPRNTLLSIKTKTEWRKLCQ